MEVSKPLMDGMRLNGIKRSCFVGLASPGDGMRTLLFFLLSALLCLGLISCVGKPSEEVIREGLTAKFEALKNLDEDSIGEVLGDYPGNEYFDQMGIDYVSFCNEWFDGFEYEIGDVSVDGDNATVTATVTIKSLAAASMAYANEIEGIAQSGEYTDMPEEELYKVFGAAFMRCVENAETVTTTVELPYVRTDTAWEPGPEFNMELNKAFTGSGG